MSAQSNVAPVIIKRKKVVGGDGHHGGAWKVAYADFVTAMMAFFLLMWLLNATTEQQRKGVADYFSPTVPVNRISGGGDGNFGGDSVFSEEALPQRGTGATNMRPTEARQARGEMGVLAEGGAASSRASGDKDEEAFAEMERALMARGGESRVESDIQRHIITRVTDEGLIVELFELEGAPLFSDGTLQPTRLLRDLVDVVGDVAGLFDNKIAIGGHTRSAPVVLAENPVWDVSTARANVLRKLLEDRGLARDRIKRMTGHADKSPAVSNPMALRNNRLEIIFLRTAQPN